MFARDFPVLYDCEWGYPLGGFGGIRRHARLRHVPVIFVHGNQADAQNWFTVRDQFKADGYTDQELYAVSYNGLGLAGAGLPTRTPPDAESLAYWQANPSSLYSGGHGAADDVNVPDLYAFTLAVMSYTGSRYVDFVAHSLGVTIVRKMLFDHRWLYSRVPAAVLIAGANHGTSLCRGLAQTYYGCDEIAPGTAWLAQLNSIGESPRPTCWMSIYNGLEGDPFFIGPDEQSPHLAGAFNLQFPGYYHNDLRVDAGIVADYEMFIQGFGQRPQARCPVHG
jgi:pimeloyl-ACP methyl ester carboxylesterase